MSCAVLQWMSHFPWPQELCRPTPISSASILTVSPYSEVPTTFPLVYLLLYWILLRVSSVVKFEELAIEGISLLKDAVTFLNLGSSLLMINNHSFKKTPPCRIRIESPSTTARSWSNTNSPQRSGLLFALLLRSTHLLVS